jgi:hypothetical protein
VQRIDSSYIREPESDAGWMRGSLYLFQLRLQLMRFTNELTTCSKLAERNCLDREESFSIQQR